jgi:hypothetical protein
MSLETYLPVGGGRYLIGSEPGSPDVFYYLVPDRRDHLRVGFRTVHQGRYGDNDYADVMVDSGDLGPALEEGEYSIQTLCRGCRLLELRSGKAVRRFMALWQQKPGRFRFIAYLPEPVMN